MKRFLKILGVTVGSLALLFVVLILATGLYVWWAHDDIERWRQERIDRLATSLSPATHYDAGCASQDAACAAWRRFRESRPYPYQTIATALIGEGTTVIVISEPPPTIAREELTTLIRELFGDEFIEQATRRWYIGVDGWVEDLIVTIRAQQPADGGSELGNPLDDPLMRDRIAFLHETLFGTTYGGGVEPIPENAQVQRPQATNLDVNAFEVSSWLANSDILWREIDQPFSFPLSFRAIADAGRTGAFESDDGTLVIFTLPISILKRQGNGASPLSSLRADFRRFAIASDLILGGLWTHDRQAAIIARSRTEPPPVLPPLRFETFEILAAETGTELAQSYERSRIFAGKLTDGDYAFRDWAPIYLSSSLIDTEFGALLNITDQMLKSWSEAGKVEYIYFDYPLKPAAFAFGEQALSEIVREKSDSPQVLFNWNTAGSAAVFTAADYSVLTTRQTGSLPVTYGSELGGSGRIEIGHLRDREETAYEYFSRLQDPNLVRVVQYTLIYQMLRAIAGAAPANDQYAALTPRDAAKARRSSEDLLIAATKNLLSQVGDDVESLNKFRKGHPEIHDEHLARLLNDPGQLAMDLKSALTAVNLAIEDLPTREREFNHDVERLNRDIDQFNASRHLPGLEQRKGEIQVRQAALVERKRMLDKAVSLVSKAGDTHTELEQVQGELSDVAQENEDIEQIRQRYLALNDAQPSGWIKTPSAVLSWNREDLLESVGGHNLDARALKIEPSSSVDSIELTETPHGRHLRYNPSVADAVATKSTELSRAVEHSGVRETPKLKDIIREPSPARPRAVALQLPENRVRSGSKPWLDRLGSSVVDQPGVVAGLREQAEATACCIFVARDASSAFFFARKNPSPPPGSLVVEARDTPSARKYIGEVAEGRYGDKDIIFFDQPVAHVEALTRGITAPVRGTLLADLFGGFRRRNSESRPQASIVRMERGGTRRILNATDRLTPEAERGGGTSFFGRLKTAFESSRPWKRATVEQLNSERTGALLEKIGWDPEVNGVPTVVAVRFRAAGGQPVAKGIDVAAGFARGREAEGREALMAAARRSFDRLEQGNGSVIDYLMGLKADLSALPPELLKRLLFILEEDGRTIHYTLYDLDRAVAGRA